MGELIGIYAKPVDTDNLVKARGWAFGGWEVGWRESMGKQREGHL